MMNSLDQYVQNARTGSVRTSSSCIPAILDSDAYGYAKNLFNSMVSSNRDINKITVIDQYFSSEELFIVAEFFGGYRQIQLEVISKFISADKTDGDKANRIELLKNRAKQVCTNGIFAGISFIHSKERMHDRYFIFWRDSIVKLVILSGGSILQKFEDFISISEITDKYHENCILQYYGLLCSNVLSRF